jgi:hypothetical protein
MSGLSVRTVQRLEVGHRVSYASLRALATAFKTDADLLEREFYAVNNPTEEFIEIPRWVRFMSDRFNFGGPRLKRRDFLIVEALCIAFAAIALLASFLVSEHAKQAVLRLLATFPLAGCYLTALSIRIYDRYRIWPGAENALSERPRTRLGIAAEYTFFITVGLLGTLFIGWLVT